MRVGEKVEVCYAVRSGVVHKPGVVRRLVSDAPSREPRSVVVLLDEGQVCVVSPASVRSVVVEPSEAFR